jgi:hypothetical protein
MPIVFEQLNVDTIALNGHQMLVQELLVLEPMVNEAVCTGFGPCQAPWDGRHCLMFFKCNASGRLECERGHVAVDSPTPGEINVLLAGIDLNKILDQKRLDALVLRLQDVRQAVGQQAVGHQAVEHIVIERAPHVLDDVKKQLQKHGGGLANGGKG